MKALTIRQPWAQLVALGVKAIETRSWQTHYRGPLAIHAGAARPKRIWTLATEEIPDVANPVVMSKHWEVSEDVNNPGDFAYDFRGPLGAVVATAELVDVVPIVTHDDATGQRSFISEYVHEGELDHQRGGLWLIGTNPRTHGNPTRIEHERPYGDFTPGRYAWLLDNVQPLDEPVPAKGRQGLFEVEL